MKPVNPYESPGLYPWPSDSKRGNTRIRVFAIALSLQGTLELVLAFVLVFQWKYSLLAVGIVALVASVGLLKIAAGFSVFRSGGMALGVLALATTVVSIATVLCLPTGIAVLVLGLLVFLDPKSRALLKAMSDSREHSEPRSDLDKSVRRLRVSAGCLWCLAIVIGLGATLSVIAVRLYMFWKWGI